MIVNVKLAAINESKRTDKGHLKQALTVTAR